MHKLAMLICFVSMLVTASYAADSKSAGSDERTTIVIVFKDGRQQSFALADIARVEFKTTAAQPRSSSGVPVLGKNHFVGKWRVGDGSGSDFYITLTTDGEARKSIGAGHGTWSVVDGEAQIAWDDGWHDAIRQVGNKHEKFAYEPGKTFSDKPSNVTNAENTQAKPI